MCKKNDKHSFCPKHGFPFNVCVPSNIVFEDVVLYENHRSYAHNDSCGLKNPDEYPRKTFIQLTVVHSQDVNIHELEEYQAESYAKDGGEIY